MKKIAIITITDNTNFGNRLQNYALEKYLKEKGISVETIWNTDSFKRRIKYLVCNLLGFFSDFKRFNIFKRFSEENTHVTKIGYGAEVLNKYDYIVVGSDQIWNLKWQLAKNLFIIEMPREKVISYAPSFGVSKIESEKRELYKKIISNVKYLSVREDAGKKIIEDITGRKDVEVLVDPTMLLTADDWDKVAKKPKQLKTDKYILNYFLGELSEARKKEIQKIADENGCEIINILDKNSPFYCTGPSEFLYLEKNAFLICTDSFHSSVFAILYNRPFVVFDREDNEEKMNSRIETLISKFNLKNREYNNKNITPENLNHDYTEAYKILDAEREKSLNFLKKALDIEEEKDEK